MITPKRWHIYIVDLEPRVGSKPVKQRPCIAIQPSEFAQWGLPSTVILPLTSKISSENTYPLRVSIPKATCGLKDPSEALVDQILAWDNSLFREDLGEVPVAIQDEIKLAVREFLDI